MAFKELFPLVTVDVALFSVEERNLQVLLVQRGQAPQQSQWALPGGILRPDGDKDLADTARRVLREKVDVDIPHLEQLHAFSGATRDPRGWSISVLFAALLPRQDIPAVVRSRVEAVRWAGAGTPQKLAFDHAQQLDAALAWLRARVDRHSLPLHLMPPLFTLTELQHTCEAILDRPLDKSVFRRRLKGSLDLEEVDDYVRGAQRPAQLYRARKGFSFSAQGVF